MAHATMPVWQEATDGQKIEKLHGKVIDLYRLLHGPAIRSLVEQLQSHRAMDEKEAADVQTIIRVCLEHPDILSATCEAGHVTGSALIVHPASGNVLLNRHKTFNRWMQFGGHAEAEYEPWRVALREAREESQLLQLSFCSDFVHSGVPVPFDVDVHEIASSRGRPKHLHLDVRYLLQTDQPDSARASTESHTVTWFARPDLNQLDLEPNVRRMITKAGVAFRTLDN